MSWEENRWEPAARFEPLIGVDELACWLGVSKSTVQKWSARGPAAGLVPPILRVGGQLRWRPADVRTWLSGRELRP